MAQFPQTQPASRLLAVIAFASGLSGAVAHAQTSLADAANADGAVTVYYCDTSMKDMVENFGKINPKIKVTTYATNCLQVYARYMRERGAKRPVADVIIGTEDVLNRMQTEGSLTAYDSPERANFSDYAKPKNRPYTRVKTLVFGMTANTQAAPGITEPKDWLDFINPLPAWKDQTIYIDPRASTTGYMLLAAFHQNFGADKTAAIYKGLAASGAEMSANSASVIAKLLSGERAVPFYLLNNHYAAATNKGAPFRFYVPTSGTLSLPFSIAILSDAPKPAAAKLFVDYILKDAQTVMGETGEYPLRNGAPTPKNMPKLSEMKLLPLDDDKAVADQEQLLKWWQGVMGVR